MSPLVSLRGVERVYGEGEAEVRALDGIDLDFMPGELVAVMGPSGSGKSTCMNILGCLDQPTAGSYKFADNETRELTQDQLALLRRYYLGFIFQGYNLLARTSAVDNVELPLVYRGVAARERRERALEALRLVGLENRAHHAPSELSGGQQQRVAIARAIVTGPSMLLADEPTGNLDTARKDDIMRLLVNLNERLGITIVMVTHEPEMAEYCRRQVHFRDGKVAEDTGARC
ncbi:MAG TPA: ABC transporter ATP-binding protein [Polyangiaceae bacterium]|nr:ABC transporter ATP-binding protein [Polyangiaceae bacterium]